MYFDTGCQFDHVRCDFKAEQEKQDERLDGHDSKLEEHEEKLTAHDGRLDGHDSKLEELEKKIEVAADAAKAKQAAAVANQKVLKQSHDATVEEMLQLAAWRVLEQDVEHALVALHPEVLDDVRVLQLAKRVDLDVDIHGPVIGLTMRF